MGGTLIDSLRKPRCRPRPKASLCIDMDGAAQAVGAHSPSRRRCRGSAATLGGWSPRRRAGRTRTRRSKSRTAGEGVVVGGSGSRGRPTHATGCRERQGQIAAGAATKERRLTPASARP
eukprot:355617-Chlamydomonas_euryale.AAC.10